MMWETRQSPKSGAIAAYEEFKKAGGTIYKPTPEQKQMFVDSTKGMYKWYEKIIGRSTHCLEDIKNAEILNSIILYSNLNIGIF